MMLWLGALPCVGAQKKPSLDNLAGQMADIAPSAYQYRADRKPEGNPPESWIGLMKFAGLPLNQAMDVNAPALKKALCGLIWEEVRQVRRVALVWNGAPKRRPKADEIVVTFFDAQAPNTIPTWWNETVLREAGKPEVSADGRTFTFAIPSDTFGLVVSVRGGRDASAYEVPTVQVFTSDVWKKMDLEVEWGFEKSTAALDYSGRIEAYDGMVDGVRPLTGDSGTTVTEKCNWRSAAKSNGRRGVHLSLLYQGTSKWRKLWPYNGETCDVARTIVTVWTKSGNFSFLASDLEQGPILAPEHGFFVRATNLSPTKAATAASDGTNSMTLLDHKLNALLGNKDIRGWSAGGDTPWFAGNVTDRPVTVSGITVPGRNVAMHPGAEQDVGVGWRSPLDGRVSVEGHVADAQPGGDGVEWSLVKQGGAGQNVLAQGVIDDRGAQSVPRAAIIVSKGDTLSLVVGRRGNHIADSTAINLVIAEIGGQGRMWDLAKDVAHDPHAGNPHTGVWSFFQFTLPPVYMPPPTFKLKSQASSAREFGVELAAKNLATIRQRTRQHQEQTWDGAVGAMFPGKAIPAIPKPEFEPPMKVEVPCAKLTAQWNLGAWHLVRHAVKNDKGQLRFNDHPYGILAAENYLIFRVLDLMGMHKAVADGLDQWLTLPMETKIVPGQGGHHGWAKPDRPVGLFSDGRGCLTHAEGSPLGVGGHMDGVHSMGPGAIMYPLTEHFRVTGDKEWLKANAPRMKANVEWILRQRRLMAGVVPGGKRLWCKGLQPPHQVTPDSGGQLMQFYESEAYYWLAVQRFAQILAQIDATEGARLAAEAEAYRNDLKAAVERSIVLNPVTLVRDGTYRSFIPFACYVRGPASGAWSWRRPGSGHHVGGLYWDTIQSADPLVSPARLLPPDDPRVQGHLEVLEDRLLLENPKVAQVTRGFDPEKHWFSHAAWQYQPGLERHANIHLAAGDAPNFLRSWLNQYAVILLPDAGYIFREHTIGGPPDKIFEEAAFLERFRDMLVMEEGESLWLARATPRVWLEQGKNISVKNAPTHFGTASYEIVSDVDNGKITAMVEMPSREAPQSAELRFRHPKASPIKSVVVNGKDWKDFDGNKELIRLEGLTGAVTVQANY
ncbi:MAG: hypothetical protein NTY01_09140 [Verrucomicrobia bacterium]|nr:hypothetical protein [Verrucomicrobiota bacterium]